MPELPEVEITCRGISAHVTGRTVAAVEVREPRLRWRIPEPVRELVGRTVRAVRRRGKYLVLDCGDHCLILHLGMSGSLRVVPASSPPRLHDHVDLELGSGRVLRFNDPRRFGSLLWTRGDPLRHRLLAKLGREPLEGGFDGEYLYRHSRGRRTAVKHFLMDSHVVVGVGNIYATEALYHAGIHPGRAAGRISLDRYTRLAGAVRSVLEHAIARGGTTLRDFVREDGSPGYFQLELAAYGRAGEPCARCGGVIRQRVIGQRSSFYCPSCQH